MILRPAKRSSAKLLIGLFSESGRGKTYSALLLARGFVGHDGAVAMIETESGRGEAYADNPDVGSYSVISLSEPFSPESYGEAIRAAAQAGARALIIDSASHEWNAVGGVLDLAAQNQASGKKGPLVWQQPKMAHQRHFVLPLITTPIPLVIVCMRAKYVMEERVISGKKEWTRSSDLTPQQSEDILYEMFAHGWIDERHCLNVTKYPSAIPGFKDVLLDKQPVTVASGQRLAQWAAGVAQRVPPSPTPAPPPPDSSTYITREQAEVLQSAAKANGKDIREWMQQLGVTRMGQIPASEFEAGMAWCETRSEVLNG